MQIKKILYFLVHIFKFEKNVYEIWHPQLLVDII